MNLGERIKLERERLGITQDDLARAVGIHRNTQAKYEKGDAVPDINYLNALDDFCADIHFIRTGERRVHKNLADEIDRECSVISGIVQRVDASLSAGGLRLSPEKKGQVVAVLWRAFRDCPMADVAVIDETVKLSAE